MMYYNLLNFWPFNYLGIIISTCIAVFTETFVCSAVKVSVKTALHVLIILTPFRHI